jgi:Putative metallopeptidase domain
MTYGAKRSPVVDLADRRALAAWRPAAPDTVAEAVRLKDAALLDFGMTDSAVASWLFAKCHHQVPTTAVDTAAVVASGDGTCLLLFNPGFFTALGLDGVKFVLFHEARHLIHRHLFVEPELRSDPVFELAAEVSINQVAMVRLGRTSLPRLGRRTTGVDPREVHASYVADLGKHRLEPVDYDAFVETDMTVYSELKRMRRPPVVRAPCVHQHTELPLDQEAVDAVVSSTLLNSLLAARRGHSAAEAELADLMAHTEDGERASRIWGTLGAGILRGRTGAVRRIDWWQRWLVDVMASKLREGERLVYPKKRGAILTALGHDPMLSRRGPVRDKVIVIAYDTSGSMPQSVVSWLAELVGQIDGAQVHWLAFDAAVMPFVPGGRVYGGGGTSFQAVADYIEGRATVQERYFEERPDAVVILTDGHAPHITPAEPDKWIWLITAGGDDWPEHHDPPMACHRVTTGER